MTGATSFTRKAGFAGVVASGLAVVSVLLIPYLQRMRWENAYYGGSRGGGAEALLYLLFGGMVVCGLVMFTGLAVRHRHHYLTNVAWKAGVLGVVAGIVLQSVEVAKAGLAVAALFVLVAVAAIDELPRGAVGLVIASHSLDKIDDRGLGLVVTLVGLVGWTWLAAAMWLERPAVEGERLWEGNVVVGADA